VSFGRPRFSEGYSGLVNKALSVNRSTRERFSGWRVVMPCRDPPISTQTRWPQSGPSAWGHFFAPNAERPIHPRQIRARAIGKTVYQLRAKHRWAMNTPNAVLFLLLTAIVSCLCWALHSLANTRSVFSFVILCVVTFAIMATASYAVDHWQDHSQQ
jgi:hypothetical protein